MKKWNIVLTVILFAISSVLSAQLKVSSTGYVGINNTTPTYNLDVNGTARLGSGTTAVSYGGSNFGPLSTGINLGASALRWSNFYTTYGYFTYAPVTTSDLKIKTDVANLPSMIDKIKLLRPVSYKLKTDVEGFVVDKNNNSTQFGFIAQELKVVLPDIVKEDNGILGISYSELIPILVQVIQTQQADIELLKERISKLESTVK